MTERILMTAWTATEGYSYYPKYVNVTLVLEDDVEASGVEFTVRSPEGLDSRTGVCRVPLREFGQMAQDMGEVLMKRFAK